MTLSKSERYRRLSWRAGIGTSVCIIVLIISVSGATLWKPSDEHSGAWIGYVCGFSFLATVACSVTCLAAAILSCFKSSEPELSSQSPNTALEPTATAPSVSVEPGNSKAAVESTSAFGGGGSALDR